MFWERVVRVAVVTNKASAVELKLDFASIFYKVNICV
jgi:hypothetical protein